MNPILAAALRREVRPLAALAVMLALAVVHGALFAPLAARHERVLRAAGGAENALAPGAGSPLPPRVYAVVQENRIPAAEALALGNSGQLQVATLEELTAFAERAGLRVTLAEPGPVTQLPTAVEVRVRLRARGSYAEVLAFFDLALASGRLYALERYTLQEAGGGQLQIELHAVSLRLKEPAPPPMTSAAPGGAR